MLEKHRNTRKTTQEFKEEMFNLVGDELTVVGEYINCKTKIKMKCNLCSNCFDMTPDHLIHGYKCPSCSYKRLGKSRRHPNDEVKNDLLKKGYEVLESYTTSNTPFLVRRLECGHEFKAIYRELLNERVICPKCRTSVSEFKIRDWLIENKLDFKEQYRIKECRNIRPLPFDFCVFIDGKEYLIEYNGRQHYEENFRNVEEKDKLENIQKKDNIKKEFCINSNKNLLVIKFDVYEKLEKVLDEYFLNSTTSKSLQSKAYTQVSGNGRALKWE